MSLNRLTLKLFNSVPAKTAAEKPKVIFDEGIVIAPEACWAEDDIVKHYGSHRLSGEALNKTYHKTWQEVKGHNGFLNLVENIMGFVNALGGKLKDEVEVPNDVIGIDDITLKFKVVDALTIQEIGQSTIAMLESGIALKSETVADLIEVLELTNYQFTGKEKIRNKEATVLIADKFGHYPTDPVEALRYAVYKATGSTMLIKSAGEIERIKESDYDPTDVFKYAGEDRMAEIFNRFKPIFLAFKRTNTKQTINRISKLSKAKHKPLPVNALSTATSKMIEDSDMHWLENATVFSLFKALSACHSRLLGQDIFAYHVRNGKGWYKEGESKTSTRVLQHNFDLIVSTIEKRVQAEGRKVFIPKGIRYGLPTSEKMFVGNVPVGTKFTDSMLAAGIYWENSWGATDLDLSTIDASGVKVGWNSSYWGQDDDILYSGDITNAPDGAVEYMHVKKGLKYPVLLLNNVYSGEEDCDYKIVVGQGEDVSRKTMMDPNKVWVEEMAQSVKRQTILGMFLPEEDDEVSFVILNTATGNVNVSSGSEHSVKFNQALAQQYEKSLTLNDLLENIGFELTDTVDDATIDLSLDNLDRNTFIDLFS